MTQNPFPSLPCRLLSAALIALTAFGTLIPRVSAIDVTEPPDLPNTAPGTNYVLPAGVHTFLGGTSPSDPADYFTVTIPPGLYLTRAVSELSALSFNGETVSSSGVAFSGNGATAYPLPPGTYQAFSNFAWGLTLTVGPVSDYIVIVKGGISVIDVSGNSDTLSVFEPSPGFIKFAAPGRTFSVNGGPVITGDSGDLPLSGVSKILVDAGAGDDTINFGGFSSPLPTTYLLGGAGEDTANLLGDISSSSLFVGSQDNYNTELETIHVMPGVKLTGGIILVALQSVSVGPGAVLEGGINLQANRKLPASPGNFTGVLLDGATLKATGNAAIYINGRGGNDSGGNQSGVRMINGTKISGETGPLWLYGYGGEQAGNSGNTGILLSGAGSAITWTNGKVEISGTGGGGISSNVGISVMDGATISAGTSRFSFGGGGGSAAGADNYGFELRGAGSRIDGSSLQIGGYSYPSPSFGIYLADGAVISGSVGIYCDNFSIDPTSSIDASANGGGVFFHVFDDGLIDLGGPDARYSPIGLTQAELSRITANYFIFGNNDDEQSVRISAPITLSGAQNCTLSAAVGIEPAAAGTDVSLDPNAILTIDGPLQCVINGPAVDTGYSQLKVNGQVKLVGAKNDLLLLSGTYPGSIGETFTIVDNDGTDPIVGTFAGVPEGGFVLWPFPGRAAQVSYVGGTGNDVVITLVDPIAATTVTNTADSGPGSFRQAVLNALRIPGPNTVTFAPALSGATIYLTSEIVLDNVVVPYDDEDYNDYLTIDATALPTGITLSGSNTNRIFYVYNARGFIKGLTFADGNGVGAAYGTYGGAIANLFGELSFTRCTFRNNSAQQDGGAIYNADYWDLTFTDCTFANNSAFRGGAIYMNEGNVTITHCTVSGNIAGNEGGGICVYAASVLLTNSIVAGNSATLTHPDIFSHFGGDFYPSGANLIGNNLGYESTFPTGPLAGTPANPLSPHLAPLGNYGGSTATMALLPSSPARNAAVGSTATADQRGFPIDGIPDLGAYEAGTLADFDAYVWETFPISATPAQHAANADYDGDGRSNLLEYATLTSGTTPGGATGLVVIRNPAGTQATLVMSFRYNSPDLFYTIERSTESGTWTPILTANGATNAYNILQSPAVQFSTNDDASLTFTDSSIAGQSQVFYRLKVAQQ